MLSGQDSPPEAGPPSAETRNPACAEASADAKALADRSTDRPAFVKASAGRQDISLLALRAAFSKPSVLNPVASGDLIPTRGTGCGSPTPSACSSPGNQNRNQKRLTQGQSFLILLRRQDSNLEPSPYSFPSVTERPGLSHIPRGDPGI